MTDSPDNTSIDLAKDAFGPDWSPSLKATAPGRLELLGNHVDYNGGLVLAGAIDRRVTAVSGYSDRDKGTVALFAPDVTDTIARVSIENPRATATSEGTEPAGYLAGIIQALGESGLGIRGGLQIIVTGDVPLGFGMSSSAALCVALTMLVSSQSLDDHVLVSIARRAEHITGAPVGAMDQSASVAGGVILFDGANESVETLSPDLGDYVFTVANSGVHHAIGQSSYPRRVEESSEALRLILEATDLEVDHVGQISADDFDRYKSRLNSALPPVLLQRVKHVVSEVERVRQGTNAVRAGDWHRFGKLMTESGRSSAVDYEISHPDVEQLVSILRSVPGVLGARMMGGGERGPALALLHKDAVDDARARLRDEFFADHDLDPDEAFEVCTFGPGARLSAEDAAGQEG